MIKRRSENEPLSENRECGEGSKLGVYSLLMLSAIIYGISVVPGRLLSTQIPPVTLTVVRTLMASVVFLPLAFHQIRKAPKLSKMDLIFIAYASLLGVGIPAITFISGLKYTSGTNASIIIATIPAVTNVIAAFKFKMGIHGRVFAGVIISFIGLLFVFSKGSFANLISLRLSFGDLVLFVDVISYSIYVNLSQRALVRFSPMTWSFYCTLFSSILLAPIGLWQAVSSDWHLSWPGWMLVMYLGLLSSGIAVVLSMKGIKRVGGSQAIIFNNLVPVIGIISSVILLKETLAIYHLIGFALVLAGVVFSLTNSRHGTLSTKISEHDQDSTTEGGNP